jgi:FAD/FMN-containing dehydrogenase
VGRAVRRRLAADRGARPALGGIKSLYSDSYFTREAFDAAYAGDAYAALKARYDPDRRLPDLYEKCVQRC